jgi:endonuclease/exonuclease/phosphatase family metal-dependent hydrolase
MPATAAAAARSFKVLTINTWVGDKRRGFLSQDSERLGWLEEQLRAADADIVCLQEVLELEVQLWLETHFDDYELVALQMPRRSACAWVAWHLLALLPGLLLAAVLPTAMRLLHPVATQHQQPIIGDCTLLCCCCVAGAAIGAASATALCTRSCWAWLQWCHIGGFPLWGARTYVVSTNASLAIMVRRSWGRVQGPPHVEWLREQGRWWNHTQAGRQRELRLFNPDRWINLLRWRGILACDVAIIGDTGPEGGEEGGGGRRHLRVVNMHLNIGVTNPVVRRAQLEQHVELLAAHDGPLLLCGDTNACAERPEPEIAWLLHPTGGEHKCASRGGCGAQVQLVDAWKAAGDGTAGWTWSQHNPMTDGPLLEPNQRLDLVLHNRARDQQGRRLWATHCEVLRYLPGRWVSDHYAVLADLVLCHERPPTLTQQQTPTSQPSKPRNKARRGSGGGARARRGASPSLSPAPTAPQR